MPDSGTVKILPLDAGDDLETVAFGLRPQATVPKHLQHLGTIFMTVPLSDIK